MGPALQCTRAERPQQRPAELFKSSACNPVKVSLDLLIHSRLHRGTQYVEHLTTLLYKVSLAIPNTIGLHKPAAGYVQVSGRHLRPSTRQDHLIHYLPKLNEIHGWSSIRLQSHLSQPDSPIDRTPLCQQVLDSRLHQPRL